MGWVRCSCGLVLHIAKGKSIKHHLEHYPDHHEVERWTFGGKYRYGGGQGNLLD